MSCTEGGEYYSFSEKLKPHTTFHPRVRNRRLDGTAARSMKTMESHSPVPVRNPLYSLIYTLHDPVGIAHELTNFTDNELQDWCGQCVLGAKPVVRNTEMLSAEQRVSLRQEQEEKLVKALHEVLGLPLSEKLLQEEEQKKVERLKAEMQALQHIHN
ncbi:hypothetical protein ACQK5W_14240 [Pantoea sp. FN060301]|uniref:hypothetical protein n=1 Tax=Pantoea sp. FN060301 TaxID=3420380 RepID=UPI003D17377F